MNLAALFPHALDIDPSPESLARLPAKGGVYLLTDGENRPIQLATSADLRRALEHRLSGPEQTASPTIPPDSAADAPTETTTTQAGKAATPRRRLNLSEIVRRVWWKPGYSQFEVTYEYHRLARVLMPQTYRKQLAFGPAWFVHVDPAAHTPQFTAGKFLRSPPGVDLGPFATQSDATRFIEILQETFDLCRYHHILEQAPHGQACAYFEMGKCPAPCDGTVPLSQYREMIDTALLFARGQREPTYGRLERAMREAAVEHQFERAGAIKKQLERARGIEHAAFARVRPAEEFNYLVLQRGAGTTRIKAFFVRQGVVSTGEEAKRKQLPQVLERWIEQMHSSSATVASGEERSEHMWLVSHFLFKPDAPGLYLHAGELGDLSRVITAIEGRFKRSPTKQKKQDVEETPAKES